MSHSIEIIWYRIPNMAAILKNGCHFENLRG